MLLRPLLTLFPLVLVMGLSAQPVAPPVPETRKADSLALTPPMGWNSWNVFRCDIDEEKVRAMADLLVSSGMRDAGYEYVIIDDCWQGERDEYGRLTADPAKFPGGIKALADYVHARGLKFGIYSDAGYKTCGGYPGSRGYEFIDARTFAEWGVDYLKYDWCYAEEDQSAPASYRLMRKALLATGRPIVLSICEWGSNEPWAWAQPVGHLWRTTVDIAECFDCEMNWGGLGVLQIIDRQEALRLRHGPGGWNDPDMLQVGNDFLTPAEERTHFAMWAMLAAPLLAGHDLRSMTTATKELLTNPETIAIDQDPLGQSALKFVDYGDHEIWFRPLSGGDYALCLINRGETPWLVDEHWGGKGVFDLAAGRKWYPFTAGQPVRDVLGRRDLGRVTSRLRATVGAHDVLLLRVGGD